jgi:putative transposase
MARSKRICLAGVPQHVIQRGNNKQACFFCDKDRQLYLNKLAEYAVEYNVHIHAYVLMTNHVHLLLTPQQDGATSVFMQAVGRSYVRYVNSAYTRSGTLWEGRFKSSLIECDRYFLAVSRYIELNPVRAGLVQLAQDYVWSSYCTNALGQPSAILTPHQVYIALAAQPEQRFSAYKALFEQTITDPELTAIRNAVNKSWLLGSAAFTAQISQTTGKVLRRLGHGGNRRFHG